MATASSSKNRSNFWRADWFVGVLVVAAVLMLHKTSSVVDTLENRFYDFGITQTQKQPSDQIAIVAIDDRSVANMGRWPWSRDVQAQLIEHISAGKPKAIINQIFYSEPQVEKGLPYLRQIRSAISADAAAGNPVLAAVRKIAGDGELALNADARLAQAFAAAGNVVGMVTFTSGDARGKPDKPLQEVTRKSLVKAPAGSGITVAGILEPIDILSNAIESVGHANKPRDPDGTVRNELLLTDYYGQMVPSMALVAAAKGLNLAPTDIQALEDGSAIQLGNLRIDADEDGRIRPFYYADQNGLSPFIYDSAFDVVSGKVPASKYAGKVVLLGPTASGLGVDFATPLGRGMTPLEQTAHVTSSILSGHFVTTPWWAALADTLAVLLVAAYLIALLPRLSASNAALMTAGMFVALLVCSYVLLSRFSYWAQLVLPAALLAIGYLALTTKRFLWVEAGKLKADEESAETNRMMGLSHQGQGQLDLAFDRFRRVPLSDALMDNLENLAQDFERRRQFNKAQAVYEHMASLNKAHNGLTAKLHRAKNLSETVILGGRSAHGGGTMLLDGGGVEKPMLGRYQIEKELGKGAMGVVYLGKDPKIGRVVAIKTLALSQEFDGDELADARQRFFREAETAGRLQHQNIVTIFDAGEEHDLAFIAMEFLKGKDLAGYCKTGTLLAPAQVLSIAQRVAQALAYAHRQNVVHRDIKPANIMYEPGTDAVKVTDFGIARITDSSKTKTGMVLGTPSYMSPEQIAGRKVDGRSDLYSLGVMLYQLLAATLPFRGESMAELMYKIANEEAPDLRLVRPDLGEPLAQIVAKSLSKSPEARYQDGDQFAADLGLALAALDGSAQPPSRAATAPETLEVGAATVIFAPQSREQPSALGMAFGPVASRPGLVSTQQINANAANLDKTPVSSPPITGTGSENSL